MLVLLSLRLGGRKYIGTLRPDKRLPVAFDLNPEKSELLSRYLDDKVEIYNEAHVQPRTCPAARLWW